MKFAKPDVPSIEVIKDGELLFTIESTQELDEWDDRVTLRCAEHIDLFHRGFTCDLNALYKLCDNQGNDVDGLRSELIRDLVLVHINKRWEISEFPQFEYVFYK